MAPEPAEEGEVEHWLARLGLGPLHVLACLTLVSLVVYISFRGLWPTDLWSHIEYGYWILEHRALPDEEPFVPLAAGSRVVNYCWLGQVLLAQAERAAGYVGLINLFCLLVGARFFLALLVYRRLSGSLAVAVAGTLGSIALNSGRLGVIRPEAFSGLLALGLLLLIAHVDPTAGRGLEPVEAAPRWPTARVLAAVGSLFAAWVNLHASVTVGFAVLGLHALGRALELLPGGGRPAQRAGRLWRDPLLRLWSACLAVAVLGSSLHPTGWRILIDSARISAHPNLATVLEWKPLLLNHREGISFLASLGLLAVVFRLSPRRVRPVEALLLAFFGLLAAEKARFTQWYAFLYVFAIAPHLGAILASRWPARAAPLDLERRARRSFVWGLVCVVVLFAGFTFSHLSDPLFGSPLLPSAAILHPLTPVKLTEHLLARPIEAQLWNSQILGDWIEREMLARQRAGGPPANFFVNSQIHVASPRLFADYTAIGFMTEGWRKLLDRYRISTLAISKVQHRALAEEIRMQPGWQVEYEDDGGVVARRRLPALDPAGPSPAPGP